MGDADRLLYSYDESNQPKSDKPFMDSVDEEQEFATIKITEGPGKQAASAEGPVDDLKGDLK
jgi:hypothetical protein